MTRKRVGPHALASFAVPTATYDKICEISDRRKITLSEAWRQVVIRGLIGFNQDLAARGEGSRGEFQRTMAAIGLPLIDGEAPPTPPVTLADLPTPPDLIKRARGASP
jgi:hypothetical protein